MPSKRDSERVPANWRAPYVWERNPVVPLIGTYLELDGSLMTTVPPSAWKKPGKDANVLVNAFEYNGRIDIGKVSLYSSEEVDRPGEWVVLFDSH